MANIWCEIMGANVIEGRCLYDIGQAQPDNPTCPKCRHYISLQQALKRDDEVETPKEKRPEGETPSTESHQKKAIRVKIMSLDKELKKGHFTDGNSLEEIRNYSKILKNKENNITLS